MAEESSLQTIDPRLVAEIVSSYVAKNSISVDQVGGLIATVRQILSGLGTNTTAPVQPPEKLTPAVPIRRSVQPDHVACLECGFQGKILRRHLRVADGLEPAAYRLRWKLAPDHPLTAPDYAAHRSTLAKALGLGRKPAAVENAATPARRGRSRRAIAD
jgi:predicted transcriptional regulator